MGDAKRPYVICHMIPSVDGRIVTARWKLPPDLIAEYDRTARELRGDAWMVGRISMAPYAGKERRPTRRRRNRARRADFIARRDAASYAVALDPSGKLEWRSGSIDEDHVIAILGDSVSDDYLTRLRANGVSYLFGGKAELDLKRVLTKLRKEFGIAKLLLEGGGAINGTFLAADLVDELSVLIAPVADGSVGTPTLFDVKGGKGAARRLKLVSFEKRAGDLLWVRYARSRSALVTPRKRGSGA